MLTHLKKKKIATLSSLEDTCQLPWDCMMVRNFRWNVDWILVLNAAGRPWVLFIIPMSSTS